MKAKEIIKRIAAVMLAFVMTLCLLFTYPALQPVFAEVGQDVRLSNLYLKAVKMFYGVSEAKARAACEGE